MKQVKNTNYKNVRTQKKELLFFSCLWSLFSKNCRSEQVFCNIKYIGDKMDLVDFCIENSLTKQILSQFFSLCARWKKKK